MTLGLAGVLADARALWRSERELLMPIAGMFFVVPMLGIALLLNGENLAQAEPEKLYEAVLAFQAANWLPLLLANLMIEVGTFAVMNLYLQGNGRTLGEVLQVTLRHLLPYLTIWFLTTLLFSLGSSLFLLPGLFAFGRTWLAGPAFAAAPERGVIEAFRQGWRRSAGFGWIILLAAAGLTFLGAMLLVLVSSRVIGGLAALIGNVEVGVGIGYVLTALIGGLAWSALALLRIAAYRRSEPRQGM